MCRQRGAQLLVEIGRRCSDRFRRADDDHQLALGRAGRAIVGGERRQPVAPDLLEQLGELARHRGVAVAEYCRHAGERGGESGRRLEEDQAGPQRGELGERAAAGRLAWRQESPEEEAVAGQAGQHQGSQHRRSARRDADRDTGGDRFAHQLVAGIGDQRHAGVADQRDALALGQARQQLRAHARGIVLVIGLQRRPDAVEGEQLAGDPGVLAGDQVDACQERQRAQRDVVAVADRRGHDDQPFGRLPAGRIVARFTSHLRAARLWPVLFDHLEGAP